jgi:hypothetical protein
VFVAVSRLKPSLADKEYLIEAPYGLKKLTPSLARKIRLWWNWTLVTNTLAFYRLAFITALKVLL